MVEHNRKLWDAVGEKKLDWFRDESVWAEAMGRGLERGVSPKVLQEFGDSDYRNKVIDRILNGGYNILPPRVAFIPKDDGSYREVLINEDHDRVILSVIYHIWYDIYHTSIHPNCKSYLRGTGTSSICKEINRQLIEIKHNNPTVVGYKVDIRKYFDSLPKEALIGLLNSISSNTALDDMILRYYQDDRIWQPIEDLPDDVDISTVQTKEINSRKFFLKDRYKSIAQGCALSALIANLALKEIDEVMAESCLLYVRYSDDMLFYTNNPDLVWFKLNTYLAKYGLKLHPDKVKLCGDDFEFLGSRFYKNELRYGSKFIKNTKAELRKYFAVDNDKLLDDRYVAKQIRKFQRYKLGSIRQRLKHTKDEQYSWLIKAFSSVTDIEQIIWLDYLCKDTIRHMYTGSWNHKYNYAMLPNDKLEKLGWVNLAHLWNFYKIDKNFYTDEIQKILNRNLDI